mmetsp:Transcript_44571/g.59144  ORF Transcript_44571/g.59144 Transcript_44571/m.59144 type:complete len:109 (-) Transcript_44571:392-718(-)
MLTYWLALNILQTLASPGIFTTKVKTKLTELDSNQIEYSSLAIPQQKLFLAYKLMTNNKAITQETINNYVVGLWFQSNNDGTVTPYMPILCQDAPELQQIKNSEYVMG